MTRLLPLLLVLLTLGVAALPSGTGPLAPGTATAHPEPGDRDGDGVKDEVDNCPDRPNGSQVDNDRDGLGDACDDDDDGDLIPDRQDNCRTVPNTDQLPGTPPYGAACPPVDTDRDSIIDADDNCDETPNPDQRDSDGDDKGDACDGDRDGDAVDNAADNCPDVYNPSIETAPPFRQSDADGNGKGTACDPDEEGVAPGEARGPAVTLTVARRHTGVSVRAPFVVPVGCSRACGLKVTLTVDAKTARRLGLGRRSATLARGSWAVSGKARTYVFLRWEKRARAALRRSRQIPARVRVVAEDPVGRTGRASRAVTLRR